MIKVKTGIPTKKIKMMIKAMEDVKFVYDS